MIIQTCNKIEIENRCKRLTKYKQHISQVMNLIISIMQKILPKELPKHLGRWKIDYCKVKINNTVDLANEDHCGPCGQYSLDKINIINKQNEIKSILSKNMS